MSKFYAFAFTWNNYDAESETALQGLKFKYLLYGREVGSSGTPHLQGTIVFKSQKTLSAAIKALKGAHVSACRDVDASIEYCKKDGDFEEFGEYKSRVTNCLSINERRAAQTAKLARGDLNALVDAGEFAFSQLATMKKCQQIYLAALPEYNHHECRGRWYYGPPRTGKTTKARECSGAYIKAQNKWFDGYTGQDVIILEDLDTPTLGHYLKIWLDKWSCMGETKGGHVQLQHKKFIVTSNYSPEDLIEDKVMADAVRQRCKVTRFEKDGQYPGTVFCSAPKFFIE